jgi:hypothetical protein
MVLVTIALSATAVFGVVGLAVDIGRIFIAKNETQAFCDAGALTAAASLDGTTTGISRAQAAVTASTNAWNFGTTSVPSPVVTFATATAGPWVASPSPATGYLYARVTTTVSVPLYFLLLVAGQSSFSVVSTAAGGQVPITSLKRGVAPYTAVSTNGTGPNFGLTVGNVYDIQWPQYNGTRNGCGANNPDKCFNSPPCSGDPKASEAAVVAAWGSAISGYWGSSSNSTIEQEVLDVIQLGPVVVGGNIAPLLSNGNKASEAGYLDERAGQDTNTTDNTVSTYLASSAHNGRRLMPVVIVNPVDSTHTNVVGYGQFLLYANGTGTNYYKKNTNGNDPFCAIYAGPYNIGSLFPGAGGSTGATWVKLVD